MPKKYRYRGGQLNPAPLPLILSKPIDALGSSESAISIGNSQINESILNKQLMGGSSSSITVPSFPSPPGGSISPYDGNNLSQMVNSQFMQANENARNDFYAYQQGGIRMRHKKRKTNRHRGGKKTVRKSLSRKHRKKSKRSKRSGGTKRKHADDSVTASSTSRRPRHATKSGNDLRFEIVNLDKQASRILLGIQDTIDNDDDESHERAQQALSDIRGLIKRQDDITGQIVHNYRYNGDKSFFNYLDRNISTFSGETLAHLERALTGMQEEAIPESMGHLSYIMQSPQAREVRDRINWQENFKRLSDYVTGI